MQQVADTTKARSRALSRAAVRRTTTAVGPRIDHLLPAWRRNLAHGLTVFIFHEITATPAPFHREYRIYTSPKVFAEQLSWIERRFTIIDPIVLPQFGGTEQLPENAAVLTFDDAWAGLFDVGLSMLEERGLGALLFLNMATVHGEPDLGAVRAYERTGRGGFLPEKRVDAAAGARVLELIQSRYGEDPEFRAYQGPTVTLEDLNRASEQKCIWFGSHLHHHWDIPSIAPDLYERELLRNAEALEPFANAVPAFATPNGYAGEGTSDPFAIPMRHGVQAVFTGSGNQNLRTDSPHLDRLFFPPEPSTPGEWWYATHRRRVLGRRAS